MNSHRILIATDVPFWRQSTGAEQRISSLVRFLVSESFTVRTFFLGQTGTDQYTERDKALIAEQSLDVEQQSSDQPPKSFAGKIGWYADATLNQLRQIQTSLKKPATEGTTNGGTGTETDDSNNARPNNARPMKLKDFQWPWAVNAFAESVEEFQPNTVLVQYIKLGYLLEGLSTEQRKLITCMVDTHDVLHLRCKQFQERGFPHWIEINRTEEANALKQFDVVVAIQDTEAQLLAELSPNNEVVVCGHAPYSAPATLNKPNLNKPFVQASPGVIRVGYLASTNASNLQAIEGFLKRVWKNLPPHESGEKLQLVIAGSICSQLAELISSDSIPNVELLGRVDELNAFYASVDLVINPVEFGTGLKIKTAEAIAFGKPVLTTAQGCVGLDVGDWAFKDEQGKLQSRENAAITICHLAANFARELLKLSRDVEDLTIRTAAAQQLAQTLFSDHRVYAAFKACLLRTERE